MKHHCRKCERETEHSHMHDTAHGISGTHMTGSERFDCLECGTRTMANLPHDFQFVLDKPALMELSVDDLLAIAKETP